MLLGSRADLSPLEVLAQVAVDREALHLRLGQHRPDVDHLGQGQVEGLQGVCPVLLLMNGGKESELLQHFAVLWCWGLGEYHAYVTLSLVGGEKLVPVESKICGLCW